MCLRVHSNADQQQLHCIFRKALGPREVSLEEEHLSGCDLSNASEILGDPQRVLSELRTCPAPARPWSQLGPPPGVVVCTHTSVRRAPRRVRSDSPGPTRRPIFRWSSHRCTPEAERCTGSMGCRSDRLRCVSFRPEPCDAMTGRWLLLFKHCAKQRLVYDVYLLEMRFVR